MKTVPHNYSGDIKKGKNLTKQQKISNGLFWRNYHQRSDTIGEYSLDDIEAMSKWSTEYHNK